MQNFRTKRLIILLFTLIAAVLAVVSAIFSTQALGWLTRAGSLLAMLLMALAIWQGWRLDRHLASREEDRHWRIYMAFYFPGLIVFFATFSLLIIETA